MADELDRLGFLIGRWVGVRSGEAVEELWTRVSDTSMMGMFCWSRDDGPHLYEFLVIEERVSGTILWLRAFAPGSTEPDPHGRPLAWRLVRCTDDEVVFDGVDPGQRSRITYRRLRADRLHATLEREEGGRMQIYPYHYRLAPFEEPVAAPAAEGRG
jgi:hypothetical protein